jgi:dipeptidyl aminopeptidase/acylaminoacyl peptidase
MSSFSLNDLIVKENGDILLLAEQYDSYEIGPLVNYNYKDILVVNYSQDAGVNLMKMLKKRPQPADRFMYSSFSVVSRGNTVHLVYNATEADADVAKYDQMSASEKKNAQKNAVAAMYTIEENGEIYQQKLFDMEDDIALRPQSCMQMSEREMLLLTSSLKGQMNILTFGWLIL